MCVRVQKPLLVKEEEGGLAAVTDFATIATPTMGKLTTTKQR